jgi:hypothetical protein
MSNAPPPTRGNLAELEAAVENMLCKELDEARAAVLPNEDELSTFNKLLDEFAAWADTYGYPTTPHVLAAYLVELHKVYKVKPDVLRWVAQAYQFRHDWDCLVPVLAALRYCVRADQQPTKDGDAPVTFQLSVPYGVVTRYLERKGIETSTATELAAALPPVLEYEIEQGSA